jgi:hypothetical protein
LAIGTLRVGDPAYRKDQSMSTTGDDRELWRIGRLSCVMVSCCAGAELQIRDGAAGDEQVVRRELYPMKSDLYERARDLEAEYRQAWNSSFGLLG